MTPELKEDAKDGPSSALGKITQAGYSSLDVSSALFSRSTLSTLIQLPVNPIFYMRSR
jgi:hypothetical protein